MNDNYAELELWWDYYENYDVCIRFSLSNANIKIVMLVQDNFLHMNIWMLSSNAQLFLIIYLNHV